MCLSGFMVIMCLVFAYFLMFTELMEDRLYGQNRWILTGVLLAYAAFRVFRLYRSIQEYKKQDEI
jgi:FlaA1/EpsC-like NDP-sugar epimerase